MRLLLPTTLEESQADTSWHGSAVTLFLAFRPRNELKHSKRRSQMCWGNYTGGKTMWKCAWFPPNWVTGGHTNMPFLSDVWTDSLPLGQQPAPLPACLILPSSPKLSYQRQTYPWSYSYDRPHGSSNEQASGRKTFPNCLCKQSHPAWMQFYQSTNSINPDNPIYDCFHKYLKGVKLKQLLQ